MQSETGQERDIVDPSLRLASRCNRASRDRILIFPFLRRCFSTLFYHGILMEEYAQRKLYTSARDSFRTATNG